MTIAITNQKGGVWKTATTINVGAALAELGKRVLLVDMDPSGDLTTHAGIELQDGDSTIYEVLTDGVPVADAVRHITRDATGTAYDVLPADTALADLTGDHRTALRDVLADLTGYDYALIDTPPSVGLPMVAALTAADRLLVPAMPSLLSVSAVHAVQRTVRDVRAAGLNTKLSMGGVVLTDYRGRSLHHRDVAAALRDALPGVVLDVTISNAIAAVEAAAAGQDVFAYAAATPRRRKTPVLQQYRDLADILTTWEATDGTD